MKRKRWWQGGVLGIVGFLLSPLSWWNDAFINLPLAIAFAWLVGLIYKPAFEPAVVFGYWLTNVIGFVLMHKAAQKMKAIDDVTPYTRTDLIRDLAISLVYTLLIIVLLKLRVLKPIEAYRR